VTDTTRAGRALFRDGYPLQSLSFLPHRRQALPTGPYSSICVRSQARGKVFESLQGFLQSDHLRFRKGRAHKLLVEGDRPVAAPRYEAHPGATARPFPYSGSTTGSNGPTYTLFESGRSPRSSTRAFGLAMAPPAHEAIAGERHVCDSAPRPRLVRTDSEEESQNSIVYFDISVL
jgi:hypothetical protein